MKEHRYMICNFAMHDRLTIESRLQSMAERGWMPEKPGSFAWRFRRTQPKKLRFAVTYYPDSSEYYPSPTEGDLTRQDYITEAGWQLALRWGAMRIFFTEDENAVPIETDPVVQVENIHRSMKKNVLISRGSMLILSVWFIVLQLNHIRQFTPDQLSNNFTIFSMPMWLILTAACVYELCSYFIWYKRAKKAAEEGYFLSDRTNAKIGWLLVALSGVFMLLAFGSTSNYILFLIVWTAFMALIIWITNIIKNKLKAKGVRRWVNLTVTTGTVLLLTFLGMGLLTAGMIRGDISFQKQSKPVGSYEYQGREWDIYADELPLNVEDMLDIEGNWSKRARIQESVLLRHSQYTQRALFTEPREVPNMEYDIIDVKAEFLYDFVKRSMIGSRQDEVHGDYVFVDHYEPTDPAVWGADEAYRLFWSDYWMDQYLLCYDGMGRIVEIDFHFEPDAEDMGIAANILQNVK